MSTSLSVGADLLLVVANALEQGENGESLPLLVLVDQVGDAVSGTGLGLEVKVNREERNIGERVFKSGLLSGKGEVTSFYKRESSLSSGGISEWI